MYIFRIQILVWKFCFIKYVEMEQLFITISTAEQNVYKDLKAQLMVVDERP